MRILYNIGLNFYHFSIFLASFFNAKAQKWISGRKQIFQKIQLLNGKNEIRYWFHCASLGEFEQGRPLVEEVKKQNPEIKIVLTFFSPSGYEVQKNYEFADYVFYLPIDSKKNAKRFIDYINPQKVFFIKYEFWYYYLKTLSDKNIPTYLVSAIFRKNQIFFKWYGNLYKNMLHFFSLIFVQNESSLKLLKQNKFDNVIISGDTRFDRVWEIAQQNKKIELLDKYLSSRKVFVSGSTWSKDEDIICDFINKNTDDYIYIIAPHNVEKTNITSLESKLKVSSIKYSSLLSEQKTNNEKVIIIDTIGILSRLYKYATITYVGGGFGSGIHNILEACVFGSPVIFGPQYQKFSEAFDSIELQFGFSIKNKNEFATIILDLINNQNKLKIIKNSIKEYFVNRKGAFNIILKRI